MAADPGMIVAMNSIVVSALGLILAVQSVGLPRGAGSASDRLEVAERPAGEVVQGIPVKEREEPEDNDAAADQAQDDAEARLPSVEQPSVADPPDVVQPREDQ